MGAVALHLVGGRRELRAPDRLHHDRVVLEDLLHLLHRRLALRDVEDRARLVQRLVELWIGVARSEEHTSELQSLMRISYAVFCLKKKIDRITFSDCCTLF